MTPLPFALAGALALACTACGSPSASPSTHHGKRSTPTSAAPSTTAPAPTSTTTTTTVASLSRCTAAQLQVSAGQQGAGLGHEGGAILFENVGTSTCSLQGYPGVAGLSTTGAQAVQAERTPQGYLGGLSSSSATPPLVVLQPHGVASALAEGTDMPTGTETSCPTYHSLLVTPPTSTHSTKVAMGLPGCSPIEVHPVVPGPTGQQAG